MPELVRQEYVVTALGGWLKPKSRCLVPFNSIAEYAPEPNPDTNRLRWDLDGVQGRPRHLIQAGRRSSPRLPVSDDLA